MLGSRGNKQTFMFLKIKVVPVGRGCTQSDMRGRAAHIALVGTRTTVMAVQPKYNISAKSNIYKHKCLRSSSSVGHAAGFKCCLEIT